MAISKQGAFVAVTVMAALSIQVGCGDGKRAPVRPRKSIPTEVTQKKLKIGADGKPVLDKNGKPVYEVVSKPNDPNAKPKDLSVPKLDPNLEQVAKYEEPLKGTSYVTAGDLVAGDYELNTITTSTRIMGRNVGEETRAIQENRVVKTSNGQYDLQKSSSLSGGMIPSFVDTRRDLDIPVKFSVKLDNGKWNPVREQANNLTFANLVTTGKEGKAEMNDSLANPNAITAGFFNFLTAGSLQKDNSYLLKDEQGITMVAHFFKTETTLNVFITFEEQRSTKGNVDMDRNVFLKFDVKPAPAQTATAAANNSPDQIHVTQTGLQPEAQPAAQEAQPQDPTALPDPIPVTNETR